MGVNLTFSLPRRSVDRTSRWNHVRFSTPIALLGLALFITACPPDDGGGEEGEGEADVTLVAVEGSYQSFVVGGALPVNVVVQAVRDGAPVSGLRVSFSVDAGSLATAAETTDADGRVSPGVWTLGTVAGRQALVASARGAASLTIEATAEPDAPITVVAVDGDNQSAPVSTAVAVAPALRISDVHDNPVPGLQVTFTVQRGGGSLTGGLVETDADGVARVGSWTLGPSPGENILEARTPGLPVTVFAATGAADGEPYAVIHEGNNQVGAVEEALPVAPAVRVVGGDGQPLADTVVVFSVESGGGSIEGDLEVATDATGVARVGAWILGPAAGDQTLRADPAGEIPPLSFRATAVGTGEPTLSTSVVVDNINNPWDMVFAPDGTLVFTLRSGAIRILRPGADHVLLHQPDDVSANGQSGMLGVALDPAFADPTQRFLYVYFSSDADGAVDNRIVRFRVAEDWSGVSDRQDLLTGITWSGGAHSGGRLRFGPDGHLWATTGDTRQSHVPQDPQELGSKVLRIARDGSIPSGNMGPPYRPEIFAFGFRNPQGIAFRPGSGQPFLCEHGPGTDDEVTLVEAGGNGGWDPVNPNNPNDPEYWGYNGTQMTDLTKFPDALTPTFADGNSGGMSGCGFVSGAAWRDWDGSLFVGSLGDRLIRVLRLADDGKSLTDPVTVLFGGQDRIRGVVLGPDGSLYVATDGRQPDQIRRVTPQ